MQQTYNAPCMRFFIGDVRDSERLIQAMVDVDYVNAMADGCCGSFAAIGPAAVQWSAKGRKRTAVLQRGKWLLRRGKRTLGLAAELRPVTPTTGAQR